MTSVIVPFRSTDPKSRLNELSDPDRRALAEAMLADVLEAAQAVGPVILVASDPPQLPDGVTVVADPRRGQGAAVTAGLAEASGRSLPTPYLVVNADLPCVTPRDLLALAGAALEHGLAYAPAADGTTNALALADSGLFEPLYGSGSAGRFAALPHAREVNAPNLRDDVDTLHDLARVAPRVGARTARVLAVLGLGAAA